MSTELEQMTGAGGTIVLGGKTYLLKQLSLGDYAQVQAWLRQRMPKPFAVVADALKDLEPLKAIDPEGYAEARKLLLLSAMEDAKSADGAGAPPELVEQALNSPDGVAFLLWLCVRKSHPDVQYEGLRTLVLDEDLSSIKSKLDDITIFAAPDDGEDEEGRPAGNRKARRSKRA
jgi:hypothetical protein